MHHDPADLIALFDGLFGASEGTRLERGGKEPLYLPRDGACAFDRVVFAHGFFSSALHEIAHWCVAGPARRRLVDYGYWYRPDGRTTEEQREFEHVEVKPQALEWIFATAAGSRFNFSADNLAGAAEPGPSWLAFQAAVAAQARAYVEGALPARARAFASALAVRYGSGDAWLGPDCYQA